MATDKDNVTAGGSEYRPCWVHSRRALFHRWVDSARPVKGKGMEDTEPAPRYQLHSVHALVEFEDGTLLRVWPQEIQFADYRDEFLNEWPALPFTMSNGDQEADNG